MKTDWKRLLKETDPEMVLQQLKTWVDLLETKLGLDIPNLDDRIQRSTIDLNSAGFDPWGLHPETIKKFAPILHGLYKKYFRVEVAGATGLPEGRAMFIGNHGGQIPLDAMLAGMALFLEGEPPRVARGMVERWVPTVPWVSSLFTRLGAIIGDPLNCRELLQHDQSVFIFPEGTRGSGKLFKDRYQLQRFGTGFMRLALETKTPIIPVAIIGTEETYPGVFNFEALAKLIQAPYFPITPFFPLLGPLGLLPLPTKVTIRFGKPMIFEGDHTESEDQIREKVAKVKDALTEEIQIGLKIRGDRIFTGAAK